jgi:5-methylcytosine-specific restriction protein A
MNKSSYSDFSLKIDGIDYDKIGEFKNGPHKLDFYIDVLTTDSSLSHGLLNQEESDLLDTAVSLFVALLPKSSIPYTNPDEVLGYPEGATSQVLVNRYERDPRNRAKAIAIHGHKCLACGFDFSQSYGDLGTDFIIVHHIVPISKISPDYIVDPEKDLVTLCANCHSMIHRKDPPLSLEELRSIVSKSD